MLSLFYGGAAALYFFWYSPEQLTDWLTAAGRPPKELITPINIIPYFASEFKLRFISVSPFIAGGIALGLIIPLILGVFNRLAYRSRMKESKDSFRGVGITFSNIPQIKEPKKANLKFKLPKGISKKHKPLLLDILNYLGQHPDAFVGDGHKGTLLEHTLNVVEKALNHPDPDSLLLLAAAAHDIGKTTSHKKVGNEWQRQAFHDKESARILVSFDSWWKMDETERTILVYAIRYEHSKSNMPYSIPGLVNDEVARARKLLDQLHEIDGQATKEEKAEVLKDIDVGEAVISAFLRALPEMPFQVRGMKKAVSACGWRQGDLLYLLEHRVRDLSVVKMDADQAAALGGKYREKGQVSAYSQALFDALEAKGWLIRTLDAQRKPDEEPIETTVPLDFPLWKISAGTASFNGVYVIELPEDMRHYYPAETQYTITVLEPLGKNNKVLNVLGDGKSRGKRKETKSETKPLIVSIPPIEPEKPKEKAEKPVETTEILVEIVETPKETPVSTEKVVTEKSAPVARPKPNQKPKEATKPPAEKSEQPVKSEKKESSTKAQNSKTTTKPIVKPIDKIDEIGDVDFVDDDCLF